MNSVLLVFLFVIAIVHSVPFSKDEENEWKSFKDTHKKSYRSLDDENERMNIFVKNKRKIDAHNNEFKKGKVSYKMALNQHADKTGEEFIALHTGFNLALAKNKRSQSAVTNTLTAVQGTNANCSTTTASCDWRNSGYVTPVKNQGQCGSCWAFSAIGAVEFAYLKKYGKSQILSEQNLVDCVTGSYGCNGGYMNSAFKYMSSNPISLSTAYPYKAADGTCQKKTPALSKIVSKYIDVTATELELQKAVFNRIVSIAFHVEPAFQFYSGGVFTSSTCKPELMNHAMLAIGYGSDNGKEYWLLKNSWGTGWGEKGFIKVAKNKNNMCGIASMASYPDVI